MTARARAAAVGWVWAGVLGGEGWELGLGFGGTYIYQEHLGQIYVLDGLK